MISRTTGGASAPPTTLENVMNVMLTILICTLGMLGGALMIISPIILEWSVVLVILMSALGIFSIIGSFLYLIAEL